jgi:SAM-dependent methyltransferase
VTGGPTEPTDSRYLLERQYAGPGNLDARIALHAQFSTNPGWYKWLFAHFSLPPNGRILELGCGSAQMWKHLRAQIPDGWEIMLTDLSPGMIAAARQSVAELQRPFRFQVADAQAIPFPDGSYDAVVANHMLYHVPDRDRAFAEIRRVLRPRGHLYAATNGADHLRELDGAISRLGIRQAFAVPGYSFTLESGESQLLEWFNWVTLDIHEDSLEVTAVDPLVNYVRSMRDAMDAEESRLEAFRAWAKSELDAKGSIHITKSSGLFTAS